MFTALAPFVFAFSLLGGSSGDVYPLDTDAVSGEKLGDKPVIMQVEGREFRFANQANADKFKAEPAKFKAAVDEKIVAQQTALYPLDTCPISGKKLGEMGKPMDVVVGNRLVRLCCGGCKSKLEKDSAATIAKLDEAVIAKQKASYKLETCPISGEKLGADGQPFDVVVAGRLVRLCCKDCEKTLRADPSKALAKLPAPAKQ
jgi:YHS domain-containing protein